MSKDQKILKIEVDFPVPVVLSSKATQLLTQAVDEICKLYEMQNPTRVMWPGGFGSKPKFMWEAVEDGKQEFNDSVFHIEVMTREDYKITEAPQLDDVKERASKLARRYWRFTSDSKSDLFDIEMEMLSMVNEAYAIGLKDGIGSEGAKLLRTRLRSTMDLEVLQIPRLEPGASALHVGPTTGPTVGPALAILKVLAKRQSEQKADTSKVIVIHPHEVADLQEGELQIGQGTFGETYIKYVSPEQKKEEEEFDNHGS